MPVIPFPQRPWSVEPAPVRPLNHEARIHGTFRSPSGGLGTVTGWMRLDRFHVVSDHGEVPCHPGQSDWRTPGSGLEARSSRRCSLTSASAHRAASVQVRLTRRPPVSARREHHEP